MLYCIWKTVYYMYHILFRRNTTLIMEVFHGNRKRRKNNKSPVAV